jgi:hypothetical protein
MLATPLAVVSHAMHHLPRILPHKGGECIRYGSLMQNADHSSLDTVHEVPKALHRAHLHYRFARVDWHEHLALNSHHTASHDRRMAWAPPFR